MRRRNVNNAALLPSRKHLFGSQLHAVEDTDHANVNGLLKVFKLCVQYALAFGSHCASHENVKSAQLLLDLVEHCFSFCPVGNTSLHNESLLTSVTNLLCNNR